MCSKPTCEVFSSSNGKSAILFPSNLDDRKEIAFDIRKLVSDVIVTLPEDATYEQQCLFAWVFEAGLTQMKISNRGQIHSIPDGYRLTKPKPSKSFINSSPIELRNIYPDN